MEAEAKVLGGDIEFNFWRKYFQTGREREERDLARERDECLRGWLRLLQAWENACRRYYVPVNETTAADITAWMADLCLGRG